MEELAVGSEIILKVVESNSCDGCFFAELATDIYENVCKRIKCTANERKDGKYVQFKRIKQYEKKD